MTMSAIKRNESEVPVVTRLKALVLNVIWKM